MKLLVVSPTLRFGGTEKHALTIASAGRGRGLNVHFVMPPERLAEPPDPKLDALGLVGHPLKISEGGDKHRGQRVRFLRMLGKLRAVRPDVVHVNVPWPDRCFGVIMAAAALRIPAVITSHLINAPFNLTPKRQRAYEWARHRHQQWTANSDHTAKLLCESMKFPREAVERIYHGVPPAQVVENEHEQVRRDRDDVRRELGLAPDAPILLNVGRLVPQKGIDRLIQAVPHVVRDRPDVRFVLVGDGMLREPLEQQARELGAGGHVVFAGRRSDVPRLLRAADLFVFPSLYEGFGLALVEAMTYGLGVVATSCSNVPEIVTDREHGVLCRPDDSASLLEAIRWALAHPGEMGEMGRKARSRAAEFTEEKMINATLDLIERTAR